MTTPSPYKMWGIKLTTNIRLVSSLRMCAAMPTASYTHAQSDA